MIDRCNISVRQARDDYNILSLFFFNYVTQKEPFPCLPLDYELHCPRSFWAFLPETKTPPQRNSVDVRPTDRELTLIKHWEIHFQKEGRGMWRQQDSQNTRLYARYAHELGSNRDTLLVFTHMSTQICVQTPMS